MDIDEEKIYYRSRKMSLIICLPVYFIILFIAHLFIENKIPNLIFGIAFVIFGGYFGSRIVEMINKILITKERTDVEDNRNWFYKLVNLLSDYM